MAVLKMIDWARLSFKKETLLFIGSVLFRVSAFTCAKLANGVPAVIGRFEP